ncbi:hypothetical protein [Rhodoferax mekongensis]|uniref:Uncharacterized protein n=1 Tax=Rhodoferax mekongensis TaxID=3068341 RepID=A0ABZ0B2V9_9BURK|nr:hypothetical protein [Rhodoferax sp. TBRC 17307]WNO06146.1 hypothetical protein RAN89_06870 [Rhodoferax sp. TBRC 17307]
MNEEDLSAASTQQAQQFSELLFGLRDSLTRLSLALKDARFDESVESGNDNNKVVSDLLMASKSKTK